MSEGLKAFSQAHLTALDSAMSKAITANTEEPTLVASMNYSVEAGGKRIRPLLFLATLAMLDERIDEDSYCVAGALEMIHTYSLIHDDLPAMDNDDLRRGLPTNHMVFGEGMAILAGDALLTEAIYSLTQTHYPAHLQVALIAQLSQAAGSGGMIGGQVGDIEGEASPLDLATLQYVHQRKTGALIEFAVTAAGLIAEVPGEIMAHLTAYSRHFGMAFQIKDDLLDVLGDEKTIGKRVGMDAQLNKSTYTALLGVEGATAALAEECRLGQLAIEQIEAVTGKNQGSALLHELLATLLR